MRGGVAKRVDDLLPRARPARRRRDVSPVVLFLQHTRARDFQHFRGLDSLRHERGLRLLGGCHEPPMIVMLIRIRLQQRQMRARISLLTAIIIHLYFELGLLFRRGGLVLHEIVLVLLHERRRPRPRHLLRRAAHKYRLRLLRSNKHFFEPIPPTPGASHALLLQRQPHPLSVKRHPRLSVRILALYVMNEPLAALGSSPRFNHLLRPPARIPHLR